MKLIDKLFKRNVKELIGFPSGDYEEETFDCTDESFKVWTGHSPIITRDNYSTELYKSYFYKNLYRIYGVPITESMRKDSYNDKRLFKIRLNDMGIISIKRLKEKVIELNSDEIDY